MSAHPLTISDASHELLERLAAQTGQTPERVLARALDAYQRQLFLERVNAGYAALRSDPAAWAEVEAERRSMDGSLMDGLDPAENWEDGAPVGRRGTDG
jgi:hypothetical protein